MDWLLVTVGNVKAFLIDAGLRFVKEAVDVLLIGAVVVTFEEFEEFDPFSNGEIAAKEVGEGNWGFVPDVEGVSSMITKSETGCEFSS